MPLQYRPSVHTASSGMRRHVSIARSQESSVHPRPSSQSSSTLHGPPRVGSTPGPPSEAPLPPDPPESLSASEPASGGYGFFVLGTHDESRDGRGKAAATPSAASGRRRKRGAEA